MNTARFLMPIFTLHDFLYLLLDFLLAGFPAETDTARKLRSRVFVLRRFRNAPKMGVNLRKISKYTRNSRRFRPARFSAPPLLP